MAFGSMPINPARFRSRFGEAFVAAAGPAMNLLLAVIGLSAAGCWMHLAGFWDDLPRWQGALQQLVWYFGTTNLMLAAFNLLPIPPLDGAHILGSFVPPFGALIRQTSGGAGFGIGLLLVMVLLQHANLGIGQLCDSLSMSYANHLFGTDLYIPGH
jgi:Zn-dependent protease